MNKFILVLNGPMCSGKSTVTKLIMNQEENVVRGAYDAVKWLISNYSAENEFHREAGKKAALAIVMSFVDSGMSVIVDGGLGEYRKNYKDLANKYGYTHLSINIEAPIEVLEKRFLERLESANQEGRKLAGSTLEIFHNRTQWYFDKNKDENTVTFDSSIMSPEEIVSEIKKMIS